MSCEMFSKLGLAEYCTLALFWKTAAWMEWSSSRRDICTPCSSWLATFWRLMSRMSITSCTEASSWKGLFCTLTSRWSKMLGSFWMLTSLWLSSWVMLMLRSTLRNMLNYETSSSLQKSMLEQSCSTGAAWIEMFIMVLGIALGRVISDASDRVSSNDLKRRSVSYLAAPMLPPTSSSSAIIGTIASCMMESKSLILLCITMPSSSFSSKKSVPFLLLRMARMMQTTVRTATSMQAMRAWSTTRYSQRVMPTPNRTAALERKLRKAKILKILKFWTSWSLALKVSKPNNLQNMMFLNLWVQMTPTPELKQQQQELGVCLSSHRWNMKSFFKKQPWMHNARKFSRYRMAMPPAKMNASTQSMVRVMPGFTLRQKQTAVMRAAHSSKETKEKREPQMKVLGCWNLDMRQAMAIKIAPMVKGTGKMLELERVLFNVVDVAVSSGGSQQQVVPVSVTFSVQLAGQVAKHLPLKRMKGQEQDWHWSEELQVMQLVSEHTWQASSTMTGWEVGQEVRHLLEQKQQVMLHVRQTDPEEQVAHPVEQAMHSPLKAQYPSRHESTHWVPDRKPVRQLVQVVEVPVQVSQGLVHPVQVWVRSLGQRSVGQTVSHSLREDMKQQPSSQVRQWVRVREQLSQGGVQGSQMRLMPRYPKSQPVPQLLSCRKQPERHEVHSEALMHFSQGPTQAVHQCKVWLAQVQVGQVAVHLQLERNTSGVRVGSQEVQLVTRPEQVLQGEVQMVQMLLTFMQPGVQVSTQSLPSRALLMQLVQLQARIVQVAQSAAASQACAYPVLLQKPGGASVRHLLWQKMQPESHVPHVEVEVQFAQPMLRVEQRMHRPSAMFQQQSSGQSPRHFWEYRQGREVLVLQEVQLSQLMEQVRQDELQYEQIPLLLTLGEGQIDTQVKLPSAARSLTEVEEQSEQLLTEPTHWAHTLLHKSHSLVTSFTIVMPVGQGFMHSPSQKQKPSTQDKHTSSQEQVAQGDTQRTHSTGCVVVSGYIVVGQALLQSPKYRQGYAEVQSQSVQLLAVRLHSRQMELQSKHFKRASFWQVPLGQTSQHRSPASQRQLKVVIEVLVQQVWQAEVFVVRQVRQGSTHSTEKIISEVLSSILAPAAVQELTFEQAVWTEVGAVNPLMVMLISAAVAPLSWIWWVASDVQLQEVQVRAVGTVKELARVMIRQEGTMRLEGVMMRSREVVYPQMRGVKLKAMAPKLDGAVLSKVDCRLPVAQLTSPVELLVANWKLELRAAKDGGFMAFETITPNSLKEEQLDPSVTVTTFDAIVQPILVPNRLVQALELVSSMSVGNVTVRMEPAEREGCCLSRMVQGTPVWELVLPTRVTAMEVMVAGVVIWTEMPVVAYQILQESLLYVAIVKEETTPVSVGLVKTCQILRAMVEAAAMALEATEVKLTKQLAPLAAWHVVELKLPEFSDSLQQLLALPTSMLIPEGIVIQMKPPWGIWYVFLNWIVQVIEVASTTQLEGVTKACVLSIVPTVAVTPAIVPEATKDDVLLEQQELTEKEPEGAIDGAFCTLKTVIWRVCAAIVEDEEFMADIVTTLEEESYAQVGLVTTPVPTRVAHDVAAVGTIELGNVILIIPAEDRASPSTILNTQVVEAQTVLTVGVTEPVRVFATAVRVAVPTILPYPLRINSKVMEPVVSVEGGALTLFNVRKQVEPGEQGEIETLLWQMVTVWPETEVKVESI